MHQKYSNSDHSWWNLLYIEKKLSCQKISNITKVPVSTIKKHLKKQNLLRTISESQIGRVPWNKGFKGQQIPWNKGMKGQYPYPSPFLGKASPFKGLPRSEITKLRISQTHKKNRWNGCRFYKEHWNRQDFLYLCVLQYDDQYFYKIGRTFSTPKSRCGRYLIQVIGIWQANHTQIVQLEKKVLLRYQDEYGFLAPKRISGRTECFTRHLPWYKLCAFIDMAISSQAKDTSLEGSETTGEVKSS